MTTNVRMENESVSKERTMTRLGRGGWVSVSMRLVYIVDRAR